jgi:hypothetical protein
VFELLREMTDEETKAIVDTSVVAELLKAAEHLRNAEDALLRGVRA